MSQATAAPRALKPFQVDCSAAVHCVEIKDERLVRKSSLSVDSVYRGSIEGDEPTGEYSPAPKLVCTTHSSAKSIIIALVHVPISFKFLIDSDRDGPGLQSGKKTSVRDLDGKWPSPANFRYERTKPAIKWAVCDAYRVGVCDADLWWRVLPRGQNLTRT